MNRWFLFCAFCTAAVAQSANEQGRGHEPVPVHFGVKVDVPSGDVRDVLRAVADAAGLSVIIPGDLSGAVSLRLDGIPYADAFDAILRPRGYGWRVMPSGLVVIEKTARTGKIVHLRHRAALEVQTALAKIVRQGEAIQVLGDDVAIDAEGERVTYLLERAQDLDRPLRQVLVECRFQEVSSQTSRALGINWSSLGSYSISVGPKPVDIGTGNALGAVLKASELALIISALDSSGGTRVVSRPTVLASEGKESSVAIGQQYPIPQYTFSKEQNVLQVSGFQFKDIGVLLKVTPRFAGDRVVLELEPEVSSVVSTTTFAGTGSATLPVIASRRVKTQVELSDGDTMAISGLISSDNNDSSAEVRGVGRVPVIGSLFRSRAQGKSGGELVVFVTVRLVRG